MFRLFQKERLAVEPLRLTNSLSGQLERFEPLGRTIKMYNCGPTVYDRQHIGNLRGPVLADTLRRVLDALHYTVKHVSNITDVGHLVSDADEGEDKLEASAKKAGRTAQDIAQEITELFFTDLDAVGVDRAQIEFPRATEYIRDQIALVKALEEKGYAYTIDDGVYFDTAHFPSYGKLGGVSRSEQQAGARVEENAQKRNPHDFALWKLSKAGEKRQQEWESPWGVGFPGWHIECTAMIFALLGKQIDIHIGGEDLSPIHHNNEIAQAEALTGKQFVRYWLHNAFITIEGKKVSKSIGNTIYLSQVIDRGLSPRSLRYWYLTGHYRSPMNFTWEAIEGADTALRRLRQAYLLMPEGKLNAEFLKEFYAALSDDLNTPKALALVWEKLQSLNKATLKKVDEVLALGFADAAPEQKLAIKTEDLPEGIRALMDAREAARRHKDFEKADQMREEIESAGYELKDTPGGPQVTKK